MLERAQVDGGELGVVLDVDLRGEHEAAELDGAQRVVVLHLGLALDEDELGRAEVHQGHVVVHLELAVDGAGAELRAVLAAADHDELGQGEVLEGLVIVHLDGAGRHEAAQVHALQHGQVLELEIAQHGLESAEVDLLDERLLPLPVLAAELVDAGLLAADHDERRQVEHGAQQAQVLDVQVVAHGAQAAEVE